jgi:hypothetical protein
MKYGLQLEDMTVNFEQKSAEENMWNQERETDNITGENFTMSIFIICIRNLIKVKLSLCFF